MPRSQVACTWFYLQQPVRQNEIAAVNNVNKQFKPGMTSGAVDPNEMIPKYLEKLKAAGIDKIIAAKQEQLDAFLAK